MVELPKPPKAKKQRQWAHWQGQNLEQKCVKTPIKGGFSYVPKFVGMPPNNDPITVPHSAMAMTTTLKTV